MAARERRATRPGTPKEVRTLVLLVRHGSTPTTGKVLPGRAKGLHLSDLGRSQADAAAQHMAGIKGVEAVYASPLERTRETAAAIAARLGLPVIPERGLLECDFGTWTGGELAKLAKLPEWRTVQGWPSGFSFPEGESFTAMQARMLGTLDRLRKLHAGKALVAVSHADPIKAAIAGALGLHLDLFQRISISACSVSVISYGDLAPRVLSVGSLPDLAGLSPS
ncbi:MAG: histidine phosphatase family protein [Acidimicrobiales bacterium]